MENKIRIFKNIGLICENCFAECEYQIFFGKNTIIHMCKDCLKELIEEIKFIVE